MSEQNPEASPINNKDDGATQPDSEKVGEVRFFSPSCRVGRVRYCAHWFLLSLILYASLIPGALIALANETIGGALLILSALTFVALLIILAIQRIHDIDKSAWLLLLIPVPVVNILLIACLIFWPGSEGENKYGLKPPPNKTWHWVLASFWIASLTIGTLAAFTAPIYELFDEHFVEEPYQEFDDTRF